MNNKKKIVASLLGTSMITMQVSAAVITNEYAGYSYKSGKINITADVDNATGSVAKDVVIKIVKGTDSDIERDTSLLIAADVIDASNSDISYTMGIRPDFQEGRYNVYLSGANVNSVETGFWYLEETTVNTEVGYVTGADAETMEDVLFEDIYPDEDGKNYDLADRLSLKNEFYSSQSDSIIASTVAENADSIEDWSDLDSIFTVASVMGALTTKNISAIVDSNYNFKRDIFEATDEMTKIQKLFDDAEAIDAGGRQRVLNALSGDSWSTIEAFRKALAAEVALAAVYNCPKEGHGHIPGIILNYASLAGYNISAFRALSPTRQLAVASMVLDANAKTSSAMFSALDTAIKKSVYGGDNVSNSGGGGGSGNGGGGSSNFVAPAGDVSGLKAESEAREDAWMSGFADLVNYSWAGEAITYLYDNGVVSGVGDNRFAPERAITREEFAKMLSLAMKYSLDDNTVSFEDVKTGSWYEPYVATLAAKNITQGIGEGRFGISNPITRQECCTFISRAIGEAGEGELNFADATEVAPWAASAIYDMVDKGLVNGYEDNTFRPTTNITRAEAAVILYRMIEGGYVG